MANVPVIEVIADVAQICRKAPTGTLIRAYVRSARDFCRQSRWFRGSLAGQTVASTQVYSLGSDPYLQVVGLHACTAAQISGNTKPWPLGVCNDTGRWQPGGNPAQPRQYAYVPEGQIAFGPTVPDKVYDILMTLVLAPKRGVVAVPEEILVKWEYAIQAGTLGYLLALPGMPWTDLAESKRQLVTYQAGISNARADEQRGYNAGTVFMKRRPFIVGR